jgi:hypothetical protein
MLESEQSFRLAVPSLLSQKARGPLTAMMPDEGSRCEGNPFTGLLEPPADIDIITGLSVERVKAIDG